MPVFQSLEAYWPGLQVRAVIPVAYGDFVHLSWVGLLYKSYKYNRHLCQFVVISGETYSSLSL